MKKLSAVISMILVAAMLFCSCGKAPETAATTAPEAVQSTASAELPEGGDNLAPDNADFEVLEKTVRCIWLSSPYRGEDYYDSLSETAFADAMFMVMNQGVPMIYGIDDIYDIGAETESYNGYEYEDGNYPFPMDPLGKFDGKTYLKINAESVEWILKNILCTEPDRTKSGDDFDSSAYEPHKLDYYYHEGYYYYFMDEGGGGGHIPRIIEKTEQADGSWIVKITTLDESNPEHGYEILEASAALKEVDGKRVWAVSYLKMIEAFESEY